MKSQDLEDMVLLRSDGKPTYILASLVDDHNDGITHIIRGTDHQTNTFKQLAIYNALGWSIPVFAHIPLVNDIQGQKLSKRKNAQSIKVLRDAGYLPDAICNAMLRLGWSYKDEEIVPKQRALELFDFEHLNRSPGCFDPAKLDYINAQYMRTQLREDEIWEMLKPWQIGWSNIELERGRALLGETIKRSTTLSDVVNNMLYCRDNFDSGHALAISGLKELLLECPFTESDLEAKLRQFAQEHKLNFGKDIAQPLRLALTGSKTSPSLFHVMVAMGRELVLRRIG